MGFTAVENFRDGGVRYRIGDGVSESVALANPDWVVADPADDQSVVVGFDVSDDDAVLVMLREIATVEGLGELPAGASKSAIVWALVQHWAEGGLIVLPTLEETAKPVPAPFEDPLVDPVEGAGTKPVPEIFGDPIVDAVDGVPPPEVSAKLTVAQLTEIAVTEGVTIGEGSTKAEIVAAIIAKRVGDDPGPRVEGLE